MAAACFACSGFSSWRILPVEEELKPYQLNQRIISPRVAKYSSFGRLFLVDFPTKMAQTSAANPPTR